MHRGLPREHPPSIPAAGGRRGRAEPCRAVQSRVEPSRAVTHPPGPSGETPASVAERMCRGSQPPLLAPSPRCLPASRPSSLLCLLPSFPPRPPPSPLPAGWVLKLGGWQQPSSARTSRRSPSRDRSAPTARSRAGVGKALRWGFSLNRAERQQNVCFGLMRGVGGWRGGRKKNNEKIKNKGEGGRKRGGR